MQTNINARTEVRNDHNRVTVHIWRASAVWSGLFRHLTDREVYRIGHVAIQTYDRPDPKNPGQILPGKFINFFPPAEFTKILTIQVGKTPGQPLSYQYRNDPNMFFDLETPSISIDLYSLIPSLIEMQYAKFLEKEADFTWSAYRIPFFSQNTMSSTKLALSLLQFGAGGQLNNLPNHISIPVLHEIEVIRDRLVQLICVDGVRLDSNTTVRDLLNMCASRAGEVNEFIISILATLTSAVSISTNEIEQIVNYLHEQENIRYGEGGDEVIQNVSSNTNAFNNV